MAGLPALVTPYSTSEFRKMAEAYRANKAAVHDQLVVVSADLYRGLSRLNGSTFLFGVDVRIAAKRVTRHLNHAAGLELAAAQAAMRSYDLYIELFTGKKPASHARQFDINK